MRRPRLQCLLTDRKAAVRCLNSRKAAPKPSVLGMRGSDDMVKWLERVDHTVPAFDLSRMRLQTLTADQMDEINALNIIHVSGTNGKGSVCAFTSSFLRTYSRLRQYPRTVGLYTSPHIETVRERIRINGEPISEELFAKRFFEVWNKLPKESSKDLDVPRYLQLLALLSFHVFISEKVDVGIYETHLGAEYDATNIVVKPIATAVTTIADDHMHLLGPTIEDIAWHKSGIFKEEVPAFSSPQTTLVEKVLRERAADRNTTLDIVTLNHTLEGKTYLGLPNVQKTNCSLALALVNAYIRAKISIVQQPISATELLASCQNPIWPGRFQHICKDNLQLYIDGAHNASGISHAVEWYADSVSKM
jgi:folylpolyglutamate synthase